MMASGRFRYWADPACISAAVTYVIGRWMLKPYGIGGDLVSGYLNDLLCLPMFLPLILYVQRRLGLREHDLPPRMWEIVQHWIIFSVVFEIILPMFPNLFRSTRDALDSVAYLAGGLTAWLWWRSGEAGKKRKLGAGSKPLSITACVTSATSLTAPAPGA
jgi:hypothetical protein